MNPLYQMIMKNANAGANPLLQKFQQFRNAFSGNAEQTVRQMLSSGQISQEQYNNAVKIAQQLRNML